MVVEHRADVGQPQRARAPLPRFDGHPGQLALHLADLPLVGALHPGQLGDAGAQPVQPLGERSGAGQPVGGGDQPVDVLGEPAGQLDPVAADVVERECGAEPGLGVVGQRDAGEHPVEAEPPGVLEVADAERLPVLGVEAPPDPGLAHPVGHRVEVVVDEAEPAPDRRALGEVEDRAGRGAAAGHVEQLGGDAEQRVGAGERPVGELDAEPVCGVAPVDDVTEAERRGDQRRVVLDVGAHHEDVARLEARVVLEEPEQHLAEHLDLTRRPVAAVHLDRPVAVGEGTALGTDRVGAQVALEPAEQGLGERGRGDLDVRAVVARTEAALQLALVAAERGEQRVPDPAMAVVEPARRRPLEIREPLPQVGAGVRQPQVEVVVGGERAQQLDLRGRHPGVAEQRDARRQVGRSGAQPLDGCGVPLGRDRRADRSRQGAPERRLPGQVGVEVAAEAVAVAAGGPVDQELRPLGGVRREQAGEPARDGVAAPTPELRLVAGVTMAEVERQGGRPRLVEALVEHRQQGPGERVGRPRVLVTGAGQLGDQRPREPELDAGAHSVSPARRGAEPVREPLAEPPLHAAGRHEHQLGRERVVQRRRQQLAEGIGEQVGPRGAVEVEHHSATLCGAADARPRRQSPQKCSRSSSALAAASTAAMASGLPWNFR